jgi:hypothetical protein
VEWWKGLVSEGDSTGWWDLVTRFERERQCCDPERTNQWDLRVELDDTKSQLVGVYKNSTEK